MLSKLPEKRYYAIGEVAKAFGVKPSLLRFWEKEFKQIQPRKNKVALENIRHRMYSKSSVLLFIKRKRAYH